MTPEVCELKKVLDGITSGVKNVVAQCIAAGKILSQLKSKSKGGDWKLILESVELSWHSADRYMALWEHRSELNLKEIKSLSDAYRIVSAVSFTIGKPADADKPKSTTYKEKSPENPVLNTTRPSITADTDNSRFYISDHPSKFHMERDSIDPADKVPVSTPRDIAVARSIAPLYPKIVQFQLFSSQEEDEFLMWSEGIISKRRQKPNPQKLDLHDAIIKVCNAYKKTTGKTLSVKPADAGQLRRHLDSGITLEEFIGVGEKAWKSNGFFARQSHRLISFVKHYENVRNEIEGANRSPDGNQIRENIHVRSL